MNEVSAWVETIVEAVRRRLAQRRWPEATYRLQFDRDHFTFRDAADVVPYLGDLGASHVYAAPFLKARSGSAHGYAVTDYTRLDPGLGTAEDYEAFVAALRRHGMGLVLDVVPNHMSTAAGENRWWTDVLENGPSSPYADFFDVDWRPIKEELRNRILLPVLGQQFGDALEAGELQLGYRDGGLFVRYFDSEFPLDPRTYPAVLAHRLDDLRDGGTVDPDDLRELESIVTAAEHLPERTETAPDPVAERQREKEVIKDRLRRLAERSSQIADFLRQNIEQLNGRPGDPASFDALERILDGQAYRLAHWKAASDEINYRRFFDVNELAAVSMEEQRVFEASHAFVFDLLAKGEVDGLRIDHVDGLFDPLEYLWRLQWGYVRAVGRRSCERLAVEAGEPVAHCSAPESRRNSPPEWEEVESRVLAALWPEVGGPSPAVLFGADAPSPREASEKASSAALPLYVVVEKILGPEEPLPPEWPVAGTTGYEFLNCANGLFVDPTGLRELVKLYRRFTREPGDFHEAAHACKLLILRVAMSSELYLLAHRLNRISERHRRSRDFTLNSLRTALREVLACFPVYRTYVGTAGVTERDRKVIGRAVARAKRRNPAMDAAVFDFIQGVLLLEQPPGLGEAGRRQREFFVGRFQQVTSPVMAKGVEDTAFYRYYPLISINEVGSEPARADVSLARFHEENEWRRFHHPLSMTCLSTHDTKRSQDVRARINVLSEIPGVWRSAVNRWARLNRRFHRNVDGRPAPSRNDEYLFYQTLVGIWPLEPPSDAEHERLIERTAGFMEKATHEAKKHTSWISPDPEYDEAVGEFVRAVLRNAPGNRFLEAFRPFHETVVDAGLYTALSQVLLQLTSPGVPDIYQGQELWDFSLVDPDNRRAVDYDLRRRLLGDLQTRAASGGEALLSLARELASSPRDPRLKLFVTWRALQCRREQADLFRSGRYVPLRAEGSRAHHVCAFAWHLASTEHPPERVAVVVAPRQLAHLAFSSDGARRASPLVGPSIWEDTRIVPPEPIGPTLVNRFTGQTCSLDGEQGRLAEVLSDFPVALLTSVPR